MPDDGTAPDKSVVSGFPEISSMKNLVSLPLSSLFGYGYINVLGLSEKTVNRPESIFLKHKLTDLIQEQRQLLGSGLRQLTSRGPFLQLVVIH